jgi:SAM-dependent methyltransferase
LHLEQCDTSVETGILQCSKCNEKYDIIRHIPRFVPLENYAKGFGLEWTIHARTQYDGYSGANISETRFFEETKWSRKLDGQVILEAGSGSGRFTEQAASTGAMVVSMDLSDAVDVNYASNGRKGNVLIVQGDIYKMPFRENFFDKLFCFGVLQHTPNVEQAFMTLTHYLKSGGSLAIDVYAKEAGITGLLKQLSNTKYWVRPVTKNISPEKLYRWCKRYIEFVWPVAKLMNKIPYVSYVWKHLRWRLLIADYTCEYKLSEEMLKEWAILDTFDMLSPAYDSPQFIETIQKWFKNANLRDVDVHYGYNGIEGHGTKP